ncbi:MAG TPA: FAD binding domain-containing protein [Candidatus Blautia faecigallinarum]|uniref:FAD binding domain-containing protein n=1 Tax=Candidatus Blautia faecigallinarum TaxID=2838488 RepID=A0A9D2DUS3_9FIRM|nr:FAD binding domain-containing protein [Candidatus Blautia faecigallinarum]
MLKIKSYVKVKSIAEAYELNQKKTACVLGGMVWLKMGNRNVSTAIDLSGLGLDTVRETEEEYIIGCMTSLHDLELHEGLDAYTNGALKESLRHIVGVQFRNCATVGGSIYGRYGFSDVLTMFLTLDSYVELYQGGRIPLSQFAQMPKDRDILIDIIVKKPPLSCVYLSQRNTKTDFPVLTVGASLLEDEARTVIGARPGRAILIQDKKGILKGFKEMSRAQRKEAALKFARFAEENVPVQGNMRGSAEYRKLLTGVLTKRAWEMLGGNRNEN